MPLIITDMAVADWPQVAAIYRQGIETGHATFASQPPATWEEWRKNKIIDCSLVTKEDHEILGWAALIAPYMLASLKSAFMSVRACVARALARCFCEN